MAKKNDPFVTKSMLNGAVEAILKGIDTLFARFKGEVDKKFDGIDRRFDKVDSEINFIKRDIQDIKADLSDTPSRKEFNALKKEVNLQKTL